MPELTNTRLPLYIKSLVPGSYVKKNIVLLLPPLNTTVYNLSFSKGEGVRHIDAFVMLLISVETAFQSLLKWFCFTALLITTPYSAFNICFFRLSLGYNELSPICSSILLIEWDRG